MTELWMEHGESISEFISGTIETITEIISGIIDIVSGIIDVIVGFFTGDGNRISSGVSGCGTALPPSSRQPGT